MKNLYLTLALIVSLFTGCAGTQNGNGPTTTERMAKTSRDAAYLGAFYFLTKNPDSRSEFENTAQALGALIEGGDVSPTTLHAIMQQLPVKELKSPEATLAVGLAYLAWDSYGQQVDINDSKYVLPIASAIKSGLELALSTAPTQ